MEEYCVRYLLCSFSNSYLTTSERGTEAAAQLEQFMNGMAKYGWTVRSVNSYNNLDAFTITFARKKA